MATITKPTNSRKTKKEKIMGFVEQLGMQAASGALGAGMGLILQRGQDKRQLKQQKKLQALEIAGQQQMTDYNMKKQLEMWEATNYKAQMEQLKKAGLNPALLYGMSGGGGATTNIEQGHVSGADAPKGGGEALTMGMGMAQQTVQMQLVDAQRKNIEADTKLKEANIPKTGAETENIRQQTTNAQTINALNQIDITLKKLDQEYQTRSMENRLTEINYRVSKLNEEISILAADKTIKRETLQAEIDRIKTEAIGAVINNTLAEQKTAESKASIAKMAGDLVNASRGLDIAERQQKVQEWAETVKANFPNIGQALGRGLNDLIESIIGAGGGNRPVQYTPPKKQ